MSSNLNPTGAGAAVYGEDMPGAQQQPEQMDIEEYAGIVAREIEAADSNDTSGYSASRERAQEYYNGDMTRDTPPPANRSKVVSRDVADTVDWMLPGLMRVFFASDEVVKFLPRTMKDKEGSAQATDYVNFKFLVKNHGYQVCWEWFWDALVQRCGIVKFYWEAYPEYRTESYSGLSDGGYQLLMSEMVQGESEIIAQTTEQIMLPPPPEAPPGTPYQPANSHNVKVRYLIKKGDVCIECIPPEEYLTDTWATSIDDARFHCHHTTKTRSDLIEMGFDRDKVEELPIAGYDLASRPERIAREAPMTTGAAAFDDRTDKAEELIDVYESYTLVDYDGDGISEWTKCVMAGGKSAENILAGPEEWDDPIPFAELKPFPIPHRRQGRSIADQTMDIQQIKTILLRGLLDNVYESNYPQKIAIESEVLNPDEVINPSFNGVIRVKTNPSAVTTIQSPFVGDKVLNMLSYFDDAIGKRTGVNQSSATLDPETLNNQSATAAQLQHDASYSMQELIARNFAEGGMRTLFSGLLKLYVKHQDRVDIIRLRDKFIEVNPQAWNAEMDVSIDVGLGAGSRDRDMAMLQQILQIQTTAIQQMGPGNPLAPLTKLYNTVAHMCEAAGLRNADEFFSEVTDEQVKQMEEAQQNKPDPKTQAMQQKAQADIQIAQQKAQTDAQMAQQKAQSDVQVAQAKHAAEQQMAQAKIQSDTALAQQKHADEMALKHEQAAADLQLRREENQMRIQLEREKIQLAHQARIEEMNLEASLKLKQMQMAPMMNAANETNIARPQ